MAPLRDRPLAHQAAQGLSWSELAALVLLQDPSQLPLCVRIRSGGGESAALRRVRTSPVVTYSLDDDDDVDLRLAEHDVPAVLSALQDNPIATLSLALLLRSTEGADIEDAIVAESLAYGVLQSGPEYARWLERQPPAKTSIEPERESVRVRMSPAGSTVTFDRVAQANAIDARARAELYSAFSALSYTDEPIAWAGAGPHFSSGGDLTEFGLVSSPAGGHLIRLEQNLPLAVARVGPRLTVHVRGACVGAGMELSSFASRVIAAPDTFWLLPEVGMGLLPGSGGTVSIPRRIGRQRTLLLSITGRRLDVGTALDWGLIDEIAST